MPLCDAVICINSGVGFEGLIHGKSVITAGHSDYHWAAHQISSVDQIASIENWRSPLLSAMDTKKFLYFFLSKYLVDIRDSSRIAQCVDRAVIEYHKNSQNC
jgi:capsule polysaccharide export protein KpsC/LpsZ